MSYGLSDVDFQRQDGLGFRIALICLGRDEMGDECSFRAGPFGERADHGSERGLVCLLPEAFQILCPPRLPAVTPGRHPLASCESSRSACGLLLLLCYACTCTCTTDPQLQLASQPSNVSFVHVQVQVLAHVPSKHPTCNIQH